MRLQSGNRHFLQQQRQLGLHVAAQFLQASNKSRHFVPFDSVFSVYNENFVHQLIGPTNDIAAAQVILSTNTTTRRTNQLHDSSLSTFHSASPSPDFSNRVCFYSRVFQPSQLGFIHQPLGGSFKPSRAPHFPSFRVYSVRCFLSCFPNFTVIRFY